MRSLPLISCASALALAGLACLHIALPGRAQEVPAPPSPPTAAERVLFAPNLGQSDHPLLGCLDDVGRGHQRSACRPGESIGLASHTGVRVQNAGITATRVLALYYAQPTGSTAPPPETGCAECQPSLALCSPPILPGESFALPAPGQALLSAAIGLSTPVLSSAVLYSLNERPARDYGEAWQEALGRVGLGPESSVGRLACKYLGATMMDSPARMPAGTSKGTPNETSNETSNGAPERPQDTAAVSGLTTAPVGRLAQPAPGDCPTRMAFHTAYLNPDSSIAAWHDLPIGPVRGEPIAAVASAPTLVGENRAAIDRYLALPLAEVAPELAEPDLTGPIGWPASAQYTYYLPGGYLHTLDGMNSQLVIQNVGAECAEATILAFRTNVGRPVPEPFIVRLAPSRLVVVNVGQRWPVQGSATIIVTGTQPLATTLTNVGFATTSTHTGLHERTAEVTWAAPRAYQEERPVPLAAELRDENRRRGNASRHTAAANTQPVTTGAQLATPNTQPVMPGAQPATTDAQPVMPGTQPATADAQPVSADGWETNVSAYNPVSATRSITMLQFAAGKPPRPPVSYPVEAHEQVVFQPGFGQGYPGGPGWARYFSDLAPMYVSLESLREASNSLEWLEGWSTTAWPVEPGERAPRTIAIPDLGGPALGSATGQAISRTASISLTGTMTDALAARLAIQNLISRTARVAVDTYAQSCGYTGTTSYTIDPFQTITLAAGELPGAYAGADAAIVRVLAGEVAVENEIARTVRPANNPPPPDLTSAYMGAPFRGALAAPVPATATLAVSPTEITVQLPEVHMPQVSVWNAAGTSRCLTYRADTDVPWLAVEPSAGTLPGTLTLSLRLNRLPRRERLEANVTVTANEPGVEASPQVVHVVVLGLPGWKVYVPVVQNGEGEVE